MPTAVPKKADKNPVGNLKHIGIPDLLHVAMHLPSDFDDLRRPITVFTDENLEEGHKALLQGKLHGEPRVNFQAGGKGAPYLTARISDRHGNYVTFTAFGETRPIKIALSQNRNDLCIYGTVSRFNNGWVLKNFEIVEPGWIGRMRPRYPGRPGSLSPETARSKIIDLLPQSIPLAARHLNEHLGSYAGYLSLSYVAGLPGVPLERILKAAHLPASPGQASKAFDALDRIAALGAIGKLASNIPAGSAVLWNNPGPWRKWAMLLPFSLTDEQEVATDDIVEAMKADRAMRWLLSGDVGTGKTVVYGLAAMSALEGGARVAVLMPNTSLAEQVHQEFREWWPASVGDMQLVTGDEGPKDLTGAKLVIGTTALLHRDIGIRELVIIDEQQRFSVAQRAKLAAPGSHILEVTATCVPRTQALVQFGVLSVSRLTKAHVSKKIETRVWGPEQKADLFRAIRSGIARGEQVLVVYPMKEAKEVTAEDGDLLSQLPNADEGGAQWDKAFPGRVVVAHGGMDQDAKSEALRKMRAREADILVSTTVIEVGITIPGLRRVIVMHAERYGLVTLHQIRGRVARTGGTGYCDLYLPKEVSEKARARLAVLEATQDGHLVAEEDMALRGFGDLSSSSAAQTGHDPSLLIGRPIRVDMMEEMLAGTGRFGR